MQFNPQRGTVELLLVHPNYMKYIHPSAGQPVFQKGWVAALCNLSPPSQLLLSILLAAHFNPYDILAPALALLLALVPPHLMRPSEHG